jgi:hypothetical protein
MTQSISGIGPLLKPNIIGVPIDLTSRPTDFLSLLNSQNLVKPPAGGTPLKWAVQYSSTSGAEIFVENQALGTNSKRNLAQASLTPFYVRAPIAVTGHVMDQVMAGGTFEDVAQGELDSAIKDAYYLLEQTLLGSTQDRGLASIVDSTGTYAGLDASSYASWASAETAVSGNMTAAVMQDGYETIRSAPYLTRPSVILLPTNQMTNYTSVMGPAASSTPSRVMLPQQPGQPYDIGLLRVRPEFNGIPLVEINGMTSTEVYWLDLTNENITLQTIRDLRVEKYAKTNDNEQWVVSWGGALKVKSRRRNLKLTGVTT